MFVSSEVQYPEVAQMFWLCVCGTLSVCATIAMYRMLILRA